MTARISQTLKRPGSGRPVSARGVKTVGTVRHLNRALSAANPPLFRAPVVSRTGATASRGIEVGKFTKLPIDDVAVPDSESTRLSVLLGTGTGGFAPSPGSPIDLSKLPGRQDYAPGVAVSGRLDGDGKTDLAVSTEIGRLVVRLGDGLGGFTAAPGPATTVSPAPRSMELGDLNGDGEGDLAIAHPVPGSELPNNLTVLLGNGSGGFSQAPNSPFPGGGIPTDVAIGQFTDLNKKDLVVPDFETPALSLFLGTGPGRQDSRRHRNLRPERRRPQ